MELARLRLIFLLSFVALIPCLSANIAEADEVWRRRAEEAMQTTEQYYDPNPAAVANHLNLKVQEYVKTPPILKTLSVDIPTFQNIDFRLNYTI